MLVRTIYRSRSVSEINWDLVDSILKSSMKHNVENSITGILLCTGDHFLQVLEGESEHVNQALVKIYRDKRHEDIEMIAFHEISERIFLNWGMRTIGIFKMSDPIKKGLKKKFGNDDNELLFPIEEWAVLSMIHDIKQLEDVPQRNYNPEWQSTDWRDKYAMKPIEREEWH